MEENILLERLLTNKFTFGFELEGFCRKEKMEEFQNLLDKTFGEGGNFHDDCSLELTSSTGNNQENGLEDNEIIVCYKNGETQIADPDLQDEYEKGSLDVKTMLENDGYKPVFVETFEYSSPVLDFTPSNIKKIWTFIENNIGVDKMFFTNDSCGFHHHISFEGITGEDAAWILSQIAMDGDAINLLQGLEGEMNEWGNFKYNFVTSYSDKEYLGDLRNAIEEFDFRKIVNYLNTDKFSLLNNHRNKTLEWRGPREFMDENDINMVKKFYTQLWKVIQLFSKKLDLKEINGMSKENYMKGLAEVNKGQVFRFYPRFKLGDNHLMDEDTLNQICNKIVNENPKLLLHFVSDKRICDQVIQKLFNMSQLRKVLEKINDDEIPQTIIDLAYKYIPAVLAFRASEDALFRTSIRTLERLKNARYGFDTAELPNIISYVVPRINKELFNDDNTCEYAFKLDLMLKSNFKIAAYLADTFNEQQMTDLLPRIFEYNHRDGSVLYNFIEALPEKYKTSKEFGALVARKILRYPELLKYIDEVSPYMLVSIIGKAHANNREEDIQQILLNSGKVSAKDVEEASSYLTRFYKHDFGGDF